MNHDYKYSTAYISLKAIFWAAIAFCFFMCCMVLLMLVIPKANAEGLYGLLDIGQAQFDPYPSTHDNARFCDQGFRCDEDTSSRLWEIGLGWKFDKPWLGLDWKTEGYFADWGSFGLRSAFPSDADYDVSQHKCLQNCDEQFQFSGNWHYRALVFAALPSHSFGNITAYGKAGMAIVFIGGDTFATAPGSSQFVRCDTCKADATRYGILLGAGVSYEGFAHVKPFAELNYVDTRGGGFPPAESLKIFKAGVRYEF